MQLASDFLNGGSTGRIKRVMLTASAPSVPIPAWAKLGYVTGCAGGGSGAVQNSSIGTGGAAGAFAFRHPFLIGVGVSSVAIQIGAGGAPVSIYGSIAGNAGGDTTISAGAFHLLLKGGSGGPLDYTSESQGGRFFLTDDTTQHASMSGGAHGVSGSSPVASSGVFALLHSGSIGIGANGARGSQSPWGAGGLSPFGRGGFGRASQPGGAVNLDGNPATGYGSGGGGAMYGTSSLPMPVSAAGRPGFVLLEFVEVE